jgi:hypothetical protein
VSINDQSIGVKVSNECEVKELVADINKKENAHYTAEARPECNGKDNGGIVIHTDKEGSFVYTLLENGLVNEDTIFSKLSQGVYSVEIVSKEYCTDTLFNLKVDDLSPIEYEIVANPIDCQFGSVKAELILKNVKTDAVNIVWSNGSNALFTEWDGNEKLTVSIKNQCQEIIDQVSQDMIVLEDEDVHTNMFEARNLEMNSIINLITEKYSEVKHLSATISDRMGRLVKHIENLEDGFDSETFGMLNIESGLYFYMIDFEANICGKKTMMRKSGKFVAFR